MTFYHGGDFGDILYSLPFIQSLRGGDLCLGRDERARLRFDPALTEMIAPLLRLQPGVSSVCFVERKPPDCVDLTEIRNHWDELKGLGLNLAQSYFHAFRAHVPEIRPWLRVRNPILTVPVLISRSPRWHGHFDWPGILQRFPDAQFVGLPDEHETFCQQFGSIRFYPTEDLLQLARVIAGATLLIGNQSAPMAIANGLGIRTHVEHWPEWPNIFPPLS